MRDRCADKIKAKEIKVDMYFLKRISQSETAPAEYLNMNK